MSYEWMDEILEEKDKEIIELKRQLDDAREQIKILTRMVARS